MELYSKHLLTCSSVGSKLSHHLVHSIGDQASPLEENSDGSRAQKILKAVGFDKVVSFLFVASLKSDKFLGNSNVLASCGRNQEPDQDCLFEA